MGKALCHANPACVWIKELVKSNATSKVTIYWFRKLLFSRPRLHHHLRSRQYQMWARHIEGEMSAHKRSRPYCFQRQSKNLHWKFEYYIRPWGKRQIFILWLRGKKRNLASLLQRLTKRNVSVNPRPLC